jgi:hypothetical protein
MRGEEREDTKTNLEEYCIPRCNTRYYGRSPTPFQETILTLSSGSRGKPCKNPAKR